jgi:SAM-dependent methyltransferase
VSPELASVSAVKWDAQRYVQEASFVPAYGQAVVEVLAPRPGERILDLGCGDGALTAQLVAAGAEVVAVDGSPEMIELARGRGLDAQVVDAQQLAFDSEFDAVFTNAVLHWVPDLPAVLRGVHRALRPGGRFVGECGGPGNVAAIGLAVTAARLGRGLPAPRNPWHNRAADEFDAALRDAGLVSDSLDVFPRPTPLPDGLRSWLQVFAGPLLADVPAGDRAAVVDDAVRLAAPWLADHAGRVTADYVRLRFGATRPDGG